MLKVGDRVKPNKKSAYWVTDSMYPLRNSVFIVKRVGINHYDNGGDNFIYFHPEYDWNCYENAFIKIEEEWDE